MPARHIAELMRQLEVDIAIDLAGYTSDARAEVFLHRPSPIQVNYLGYPGTMSLDGYDTIIADRVMSNLYIPRFNMVFLDNYF